MKPKRIQRKRTKGWRKPANTFCVGRGGYFGNPFVGPNAAKAYRAWLEGRMRRAEFDRKNTREMVFHFDRKNVLREVTRLRGMNLACWCDISAECHADVLLELANK